MILMLLLAAATTAQAQKSKLNYGIKAGFSLPTIIGPSEKDAQGNSYETNKVAFRLFGGGWLNYRLNENMSLQAELLFNQKGSAYKFQGQAIDRLQSDTTIFGNRLTTLNVTLNYLEVPILFRMEALKGKLDFTLGPSFAVLVGAEALGNTQYKDNTVRNLDGSAGIIEYDLNYRYYSDKEGGLGPYPTTREIDVNGTRTSFPSVLGAYYYDPQFTARKNGVGAFYNTFDVCLNAGFSYKISGSMRAGFRWSMSLLDITNDQMDFSQSASPNFRLPRLTNDFDRNMSFMLHVGFGFK